MSTLKHIALLLTAAFAVQPNLANAQPPPPASRAPFTATLSNNAPLVFGMDVSEVSRALGEPLNYFSGAPGNEIYLTDRTIGGSRIFTHHDRLYLQFRNGRLAGWKGDWGHNWMWQ